MHNVIPHRRLGEFRPWAPRAFPPGRRFSTLFRLFESVLLANQTQLLAWTSILVRLTESSLLALGLPVRPLHPAIDTMTQLAAVSQEPNCSNHLDDVSESSPLLHKNSAFKNSASDEHSVSLLPPADRGNAAWLFLAGCFFIEGLIWGKHRRKQSKLFMLSLTQPHDRLALLIRYLPEILQ